VCIPSSTSLTRGARRGNPVTVFSPRSSGEWVRALHPDHGRSVRAADTIEASHPARGSEASVVLGQGGTAAIPKGRLSP
jgi:hypothetical protein